MNGPQKIRELFATKKTIIAPGAHDMLTAKIIGKLGFLIGENHRKNNRQYGNHNSD